MFAHVKVLVHLGPSLVRWDPPLYAGVQGRVPGTLPCAPGTLPCTPGPSDVRRRPREGPGVRGRVPDGLGP